MLSSTVLNNAYVPTHTILHCLCIQQIAFKNLMKRNEGKEATDAASIRLPFIVVNTDQATIIKCQMTPDKYVLRDSY